MNHPRHSRGFTLLEVLVAVAVLALAMTAIISGGSNAARAAAGMREKTLALWVAHNRLAEIDLAPVWPQLGTSSDDVKMGGEDWTWHVEVIGTQDPTLRRINIRVNKRNDRSNYNYADLSSFLSSAGRCGQASTC
ncbi:MAG TPA: type II secretion system minor pseudopilin GspI [Nevskia sp.]|nr:type II secretion system minor pseudopilin GspI [Nevskia sp.]